MMINLLTMRKVVTCAMVVLVLLAVYEIGGLQQTKTAVYAGGLPLHNMENNATFTMIDTKNYTQYIPAPVEEYVYKNAAALGFDTKGNQLAPACPLFINKAATSIYDDLHAYLDDDLEEYNQQIRNFEPVSDLRLRLRKGETHEDVCQSVQVGPDKGIQSIFKSGQLSWTASGFVEPLLPPMRHPMYCYKRKYILNLDYLVHDFAQMCRNLKPHSRNILIDMGASLDFHHGNQPAVYLTEIYAKFGFPFDHVYAYEITPKEPAKVYEMVPDGLQAAYHWINVAVDPKEGALMNPLTMLLNNYNADDLIVIKLDIDTPAVEMSLAQQLLQDSRFHPLVDQFYFEHHVHLSEISGSWKYGGMKGSIKDSLDLFIGLRQKGIASHFWV